MLEHVPNKIVVIEEKQLFNTNYGNILSAFSTILSKRGYWFAYARTALVFLVDYFVYHTVDDFSEGKLTNKEFRNKLSKQLGIQLSNNEFDQAWNSVYLDIRKDKITNIYEPITKKDALLLIVSISNPIHRNYIYKYLESINGDNSDEHIKWANSFHHRTLSAINLIKHAIPEYDKEGNIIYSLHPQITTSTEAGVKVAKFINPRYNPNTAKLPLPIIIHNILTGEETKGLEQPAFI